MKKEEKKQNLIEKWRKLGCGLKGSLILGGIYLIVINLFNLLGYFLDKKYFEIAHIVDSSPINTMILGYLEMTPLPRLFFGLIYYMVVGALLGMIYNKRKEIFNLIKQYKWGALCGAIFGLVFTFVAYPVTFTLHFLFFLAFSPIFFWTYSITQCSGEDCIMLISMVIMSIFLTIIWGYIGIYINKKLKK